MYEKNTQNWKRQRNIYENNAVTQKVIRIRKRQRNLKKKNYYETKYKSLLSTLTPEKARNKINDLKFKEACEIVFGEVIRVAENRKSKAREITDFFKKTF